MEVSLVIPSISPPVTGQTAPVTGARSGLGRAAALALAAAGADVGLIGRSALDLDQVASAITASGRRALSLPLDLAEETALRDSVARLLDRFGRVDILVNAAGTDVPSPIEELDAADWNPVLGVNLRAPFLLAKAVFPHMRERQRGTILNVSSVAGRRNWAPASAAISTKAISRPGGSVVSSKPIPDCQVSGTGPRPAV